MMPPYKLVDMATGQDVPNMVGMDTAVGRYIEVYSGKAPGLPDRRISDGALKRSEGVIAPVLSDTDKLAERIAKIEARLRES